eukprot:TRINITY_DN22289_c0_g1_i2.p1 TRINITY_DN22289_c0_g1~~TRINITY_DN22289_c0_g1_i2.p1  ORF type:complete len:201 (+),score=29.80 TRINITY_DN22289_c0_g1_i2:70-603(+)
MDVGARKEELQQIVTRLSPEDCFDAFLKEVWFAGGGLGPIPPRIVETGDEVTGLGSIRVVPGNITEEIISGVRGSYIEYHITHGPFPVSYHRGRVDFAPCEKADGERNDGADDTLVTWTCSYTPSYFLGPVLSLVIRTSFQIMLRHLASRCSNKSEPSSESAAVEAAGAVDAAAVGI